MRANTFVIALILMMGAGFAAHGQTASPMVVELFTSKYCPNCPAVEARMRKEAETNPTMLLLQQHVDYWDRGDQRDPYGLAEATERQYDYSNSLSRRAGEVFTPMPVLNGHAVAAPPLFLNWDKAVAKTADDDIAALKVERTATGALSVALPATKNTEAWALGVEPMGSPNALRVRAIVPMDMKAGTASLSAALAPKTPQIVVLLQEQGPGAIKAVGRLNVRP